MLIANASLATEAFLDHVLSRRPSVAVFDCDGTLWANNSGTEFMDWEIAQGLLPPAAAAQLRRRYALYLNGQVSEVDMCGEMVSCHAGLPLAAINAAIARFAKEYIEPNLFPVMLDLVHRLRAQGCDLWAVSSTYNLVVRQGLVPFGIAPHHVLGVDLVCEKGIATSELIAVPTGELKAIALAQAGLPRPDAVFGNSIHDLAMLQIACQPYVINPNPDLRAIAEQHGWPIYQPS
ncbi:MAG: haloacid dehalogenase-like hydrolase [Acidobacteriaceae bacterium]